MVRSVWYMTLPLKPVFLILNQMAGPLTWDFAEDFARTIGPVALLTGHPDTLAKPKNPNILVFPSTPYDRGSYRLRFISWTKYWLHAFFWLWKWPADIPLLVYSNPPNLCWLGRLMQALRGQRYAVMVHDIYPDLILRLGKSSEGNLLVRVWRWVNRSSYEKADLVMTLGPHMALTLGKSFNPSLTVNGRIESIFPWADIDVIRPLAKQENWFAREHGQLNKLTVMYSGNMGMGHDIETMLEVAQKLRHAQGIHFMFIGSGPKWQLVEHFVREEDLRNVTLLPWQPEDTIPFSIATADVAWISLEDELAGVALPSKTFSFLAAGVPLIVLCNEQTELADLVKVYKCGWAMKSGQVEELCALILGFQTTEELKAAGVASRGASLTIGSRKNSLAMVNSLPWFTR